MTPSEVEEIFQEQLDILRAVEGRIDGRVGRSETPYFAPADYRLVRRVMATLPPVLEDDPGYEAYALLAAASFYMSENMEHEESTTLPFCDTAIDCPVHHVLSVAIDTLENVVLAKRRMASEPEVDGAR